MLLVPSFAIGRTQEVVWELDRLIDRAQDDLLAPLSPAERRKLVDLLTRIVDHHARS